MCILNAHILNKNYGSKKLSHDEYRDRIIKHLISEGLKCYKIPLPPVLSRKIGRRNVLEAEEKRLTERHFPTNIPGGKGEEGKDLLGLASFVTSCLELKYKYVENILLFGARIVESLFAFHHAFSYTTQKQTTNEVQ